MTNVHQIFRFLATGLLNTAFGYISYAAFVLANAPLWLAITASTTLSVLFNFISYGRLVFGSTSHHLLPRFIAFYLVLAGVNFVLLRFLTAHGLGPLLAQALLVPPFAAVGYFAMRVFVFGKKKE